MGNLEADEGVGWLPYPWVCCAYLARAALISALGSGEAGLDKPLLASRDIVTSYCRENLLLDWLGCIPRLLAELGWRGEPADGA